MKYESEQVVLGAFDESRMRETLLAELYFKLKADRTIERSMPGSHATLNSFICYVRSRPSVLIPLSREGSNPLGLAWLCEAEGVKGARKASAGYVFFKEHWGTPAIDEAAWLILGYWFKELGVNIMYGTGLEWNRWTVAFMKRFGFEELCRLPKFFYRDGKLQDGTLLVLEEDKFLPRFEEWRQVHGRQGAVGVDDRHPEADHAAAAGSSQSGELALSDAV